MSVQRQTRDHLIHRKQRMRTKGHVHPTCRSRTLTGLGEHEDIPQLMHCATTPHDGAPKWSLDDGVAGRWRSETALRDKRRQNNKSHTKRSCNRERLTSSHHRRCDDGATVE